MAEDIAPELLEKIREAFRENCSTNKDIQEISQKVADGTAGYRDLEAYAIAAGDMLAKAMHDNVSGDILPDGKMYYNIASRILPPNLEECHEMVAEIAEGIYGILNEQAGLHIKALRPDLNRDRIDGLVNYVSNADQYEDVRKSTEQDVVNFSQSVATDAVHKNADFQYKAGLTPKIRREAESGCCEWCQSLEGTYDYGDVRNTGNDVWRRHRACKCKVTYDPGTSRTQNAHSKTWSWKEENKEKVEERIEGAEVTDSGKEKRINYAKARELFDYDKRLENGEITPEAIAKELETTDVGRRVTEWILQSGIKPVLTSEDKPSGERGEQEGRLIKIYLKNNKNTRVAAESVIHEMVHYRYHIGGSQHAEAICYAFEKMHSVNRDYLTFDEWDGIVEMVRNAYFDIPWELPYDEGFGRFDFIKKENGTN